MVKYSLYSPNQPRPVKIFFLSLIFYSWNMICLFFKFILCSALNFLNQWFLWYMVIWENLQTQSLYILLSFLLAFPLWSCCTFCNCPILLEIAFQLIPVFFHLLLQFWSFYIHSFKLNNFSLQALLHYDWPKHVFLYGTCYDA